MTVEVANEEDETLENKESKEEEEEGLATLSLHVIHGVDKTRRNQTMKMVGYVKKKRLNVLIDSGSTYNFMDLVVAKRGEVISRKSIHRRF